MGHENIPVIALKLTEREEMFRKFISSVNSTTEWYNKIRRTTNDVEFQMIENEINQVDKLIQQGQTKLTWNSDGMFPKKSLTIYPFPYRFVGLHGTTP